MHSPRAAVLAILSAVLCSSAAAQIPRLALTETLRLDSDTEDFSVVNTALLGPRGTIAVLLMMDHQVRLYDATGKRIASVGRRGAGPGEFERPLRYGWAADTLWVYDSSHRRFTLIRADGNVIRTVPLPPSLSAGMGGTDLTAGNVYSFVPNVWYGDGGSIGPAMLTVGVTREGTVDTEQFIVRASATGAVRRLAPQPSTDHVSVNISRGGSSWGVAVPFVFQPQTTYAPDGSRFAFLTTNIISAAGGTWTATVFSARGDTVFSRAVPFTGVPIPQRVADSALTAIRTRVRQNLPPDVASEQETLARKLMPPVYAPVSGIYLGTDGTTWVLQRRTNEGIVALVLDARGNSVGTVLVPARSRVADVSLSNLVVVETDEDGLTSVVRYRVGGR